jgi:hypothetical protein
MRIEAFVAWDGTCYDRCSTSLSGARLSDGAIRRVAQSNSARAMFICCESKKKQVLPEVRAKSGN